MAETAPVTYREIPEFPGYRVGDDGSVWSCRTRETRGYCKGTRGIVGSTWKKLGVRPNRGGYLVVRLRVSGKDATRTVHTLVLTAFVGPKPDGMHGCHGDRGQRDNALSNLRWGTPAENKADSIRQGTAAVGERHPLAKLTTESVRAMRLDFANGVGGYAALARKYGVTENAAKQVVTRRTWKHVA